MCFCMGLPMSCAVVFRGQIEWWSLLGEVSTTWSLVRSRFRASWERLKRAVVLRLQAAWYIFPRFKTLEGMYSRFVRKHPPRALLVSASVLAFFASPKTAWFTCVGRVRADAMVQASHVTWLILPVVICLSQRLSHACLSISFYTVKLRMAH